LITGVLDSLERNEAEELIQKYGGRTVNTVSSKVNYIIVGDEAGPAKLAKVYFSRINVVRIIRSFFHIKIFLG